MVDIESWIRTLTPYILMLLAGAVTVIRMNQRIKTLETVLNEDVKIIKDDIKEITEKLNLLLGGWDRLIDEHKRNHK